MELRTVASLMLVFLVSFRAFVFVHDRLDDRFDMYTSPSFEIALVSVALLICSATYLLLRQVRRLAIAKQLLVAGAAAVIGATVLGIAVNLACVMFMNVCPALSADFVLLHMVALFAPFALWAATALTVAYYSEARERERRMAVVKAQALDAQMRALRYQVNPHLLYNTLNSIASLLLDNKNAVAEEMVVRLSDFFRASLSNDPHADVALADEIALQRLYLEIEQMRFPDQLSSNFDIPTALERIRVPSLILQPLIENTLKHAIRPNGSPTEVQVRARRRERHLILEIADNGPGNSLTAGTGIGLQNVRERLRARFGNDARIEMESNPGEGFLVRLKMPALQD